jgi:4-amino-4-deoxy-L-arabinose transferase-like glycosyltransferase
MGRRIGFVLGLVWVIFVISAYYTFHKPFTGPDITAVTNTLLDVLGLLLLVSTAAGVGRRLRVWFLGDALVSLGAPERLAVEALTGLLLTSVAVLTLGLVGLVQGWLYLGLAVAVTVFLLRDVLAWWRELLGWVRCGLAAAQGAEARFLIFFLAVMLALSLVNALAPETKWDGLVYHLTGPKLYIEAGRIHGDMNNHFLGYPQLVEMLFMWLMSWRGVGAAVSIVHWSFGALTLMLVGGYASRLTNRPKAGLLAVAVLLTAESFRLQFAWPYVDLLMPAYAAASFILIMQWRESKSWRLLVAAGLLAGGAPGAKYTAIGVVAGLGVLVLWEKRRDGIGALVRAGLIFAAAAFLIFMPWMLKNWLLYDNPVYPFLFDTKYWDDIRETWYARGGTGILHEAPERLLLVPWDATVCSGEGVAAYQSPFGEGIICSSVASYQTTIGPLFLICIPLLLIGWDALHDRERDFVWRAVIFLVPPTAIWLYSVGVSWMVRNTRHYYSVFAILAVLAALGLQAMQRARLGRVRVGFVINALVMLVVALSLFAFVVETLGMGTLPVLVGARSKDAFLQDQLGWHYVAVQRVNELQDGAVVRFLWEPRDFYCRAGVTCQGDVLIDYWYHDMRVLDGDIDAIADKWRAEEVTHFLMWDQGMTSIASIDPYEPGDIDAFEQFAAKYLASVWHGGQYEDGPIYTLYTWQPG